MTVRTCIGIALGVVAVTAQSESRSPGWCEARWEETSAPYLESPTPDYAALLRAWQDLGAQCAETGVYEARLASILMLLKQPAAAQKVLGSHKKPPAPEYAALIEGTRLQIEVESALQGDASGTVDISRFAPRFEQLVSSAPDWYVAHELASTFWLWSGEPRKAIAAAKRATELEPKSWWGYRTMTIAYSQIGEYRTAAAMGDRAHANHKAVSADADLMLALARSYAAMGNVRMTETVLSLLFTYRPEVRKTSQYREALVFIRDVTQSGDGNQKQH
jgi:tetratricopeptide (TPR) repeat protein